MAVGTRRSELISLLVAVLAVMAMGVVSYRDSTAAGRRSDELAMRERIALATDTLVSDLKDAETGQRGYLLTGSGEYLASYQRALTAVPDALDNFEHATNSNPDLRTRAQAVPPLVEQKMMELKQTVDLKTAGKNEQAMAIVNSGRGRQLMDDIRMHCAEIRFRAEQEAAREIRAAETAARWSKTVNAIGSMVLLGLLAFATVTIDRGTRRRLELIHALQLSQRETAEARDWLQTTLGSIGDAVIATDGKGHVVFLNRVAEDLTGWTQSAAKSQHLDQIFVIHNEDTNELVESPVAKVLREGTVVGLANHTRLTARDGQSCSIDDSAAPIRGHSGEIQGVVLVFRDVSESRAAERERERTRSALASANADLQRFAFAASHDLREPLRTVKLFGELLQKTAPELREKHQTQLDFIIKGIARMEELVDGLLAYSLAASPVERPLVRTDLEQVLAQTLENLTAAIESSRALVTHDALPVLDCEPLHIGQVFQNLIGNAIKYAREEPPRIHVSARESGRDWTFAVTDNGTGIRSEYYATIFDVFKRLHGQDRPGSGIGLATCRQIVERYHGRIWVESKVGVGSTFFFSLPKVKVAISSGAAEQSQTA